MDLKEHNVNYRAALEELARQFGGVDGSSTDRHRRILEAIERIENGSYGFCAGCGDEIDQERLEIIPEATHCISCQRTREQFAESQLNPTSEAA